MTSESNESQNPFDFDLRMRIANIVLPLMPTEYPNVDDAAEIADALIRGLPELLYAYVPQRVMFNGNVAVTDWEVDDE